MSHRPRDGQRQRAVNSFRRRQQGIKAKRTRTEQWRYYKLSIVAVFFACVLGFFLWEIFSWQRFAGDAHAVRTLAQIVDFHSAGDGEIMANRGSITDRNMQALAVSSTVYNVFVDVRMLSGRGEAEIERNRLALTSFFGMTDTEFNQMLARDAATGLLVNNTYFFVIERGISHVRRLEFENWRERERDAWLALPPEERAANDNFFIRDIYFETDSHRSYIHNSLAASVIGFERGALWGLERQFNEFLTGKPGRALTTFDAHGMLVQDRTPPIHGANIITTLELGLQRFAEEVATRWANDFSAQHSSVIVMQPFTGEIFAMAQYPSFDLNAPADPARLTSQRLAAMLEATEPDSNEFFEHLFGVWANFNVSSTFEPGSIYKPFTIAKALEEGIISGNQYFYCAGFKYVAGHRIHCVRTWGHGMINLTEALAVSCNVVLMDIAESLGRHRFWQFQRDFGYGITTGIDLPGEAGGIVFSVGELNDSELATSSFGQRFNATPIQSIASFAALINGGHVVRPHVVSQIIDSDGSILFSHRPIVERQVISRGTSDWLRRAMQYVVTEGTGTGAIIEGFAQGGKTGTAEQGIMGVDADFSWSISYVGYFPIENPQYLIFVLIHGVPDEVYEARVGQRSVTPMYREIAQEIIRLRGMPQVVDLDNASPAQAAELIEDFVNMPVQQAIARLNSLGLDFEFIGAAGGRISSQFPLAGSRITNRSNLTVVLHLVDDGNQPLYEVPDVTGHDLEFARELIIRAGFVPRVVYENLIDGDGVGFRATVVGQSAQDIRLPRGTEILLRARLEY